MKNYKELNEFEKNIRNQSISDVVLFAVVTLAIFFYFACIFTANAQEVPAPHVIKSYLCNEDDTQWFHSQTMSDGSKRTLTIKKPVPPVPPASWHIVATNDLPVTVEYVYEVLRKDFSVFTNAETRVKSTRERAVIIVPPMPEIKRPEPGREDAYAMALKRAEGAKEEAEKREAKVTQFKAMAQGDFMVSKTIVGDDIHSVTQSGKLIVTPIKRAFTARVPSVKTAQVQAALEKAVYQLLADPSVTTPWGETLAVRKRREADEFEQREKDITFVCNVLGELRRASLAGAGESPAADGTTLNKIPPTGQLNR